MKSIVVSTLLVPGFLNSQPAVLGESLRFTTMDFPSAQGTFANGINNANQSVGSLQRIHEFWATPVPEPASLLLFAGGLTVVGFLFRRKLHATIKT